MIDEGIQSPILAGKISIEGFSGDLQMIAQIADGNIFIISSQHQLQKSLLQFPLAAIGLLGLADFIHFPTPLC
jgi:hypothetical protein